LLSRIKIHQGYLFGGGPGASLCFIFVDHRKAPNYIPSGDNLKVQIRESFNAPPSATFLVGEVLDVNDKLAKEWIDAGRAVPEGSVPVFVNRPSLQETASVVPAERSVVAQVIHSVVQAVVPAPVVKQEKKAKVKAKAKAA
jgi:hypothetical protein